MRQSDETRFAAHAWDYAMGRSLRSTAVSPERHILIARQERPTLPTILAVLAIGRGRPWLPLIEAALVQIGIIAIRTLLKDTKNDHCD